MRVSKNPAFRSILATSAFILTLFATPYASQSVTVTVHPGEDHLFHGFGVNFTSWRTPFQTPGVTQALVDSILEIVFSPEEMGFRYLRLFAHPTKMRSGVELDGDWHGSRYHAIFKNARNFQPDLKYLWIPWSRADPDLGLAQDNLQGFVERMVGIAKVMKEDYGFDWDASGVFNEPQNDPDLIDDKHIASLVIKFREEFDRQGMQNVKLIAPECSNVLDWNPPNSPKGSHVAMIDSIAANPAALAALDGIGYHSYDYGPAKWFRDRVWPLGKELWQTESAMHGQESPDKEIHHAAQQSAMILSDLNLLAGRWFFFHVMFPEILEYDSTVNFFQEALNLFVITDRDGEGLRVRSWLKNDYMGRLTRSFKPGTGMRLCTSDLVPWTRNDVDRFIYMENTNRDISGESSQICAAAGRRADSSWILSAVNRTGLPGIHQDTVKNSDGTVAWMKHTYAPADSFAVTFDVAELRESGDVPFSVTRCNQQNKCFDDGVLTMVSGSVTVPTASTELVTLESSTGIPITFVDRTIQRRAGYDGSYTIRNAGVRWMFFMNPEITGRNRTVVKIFDSRGRNVRSISAADGSSEIEWDGFDKNGFRAAPGVYHVRLSNGQFDVNAAITVVR